MPGYGNHASRAAFHTRTLSRILVLCCSRCVFGFTSDRSHLFWQSVDGLMRLWVAHASCARGACGKNALALNMLVRFPLLLLIKTTGMLGHHTELCVRHSMIVSVLNSTDPIHYIMIVWLLLQRGLAGFLFRMPVGHVCCGIGFGPQSASRPILATRNMCQSCSLLGGYAVWWRPLFRVSRCWALSKPWEWLCSHGIVVVSA
eukprot:gene14810-biopygen14217